MMNAIVLLSGGLDSTTVLAIAVDQGFNPYALSFNYGQRHKFELEAAGGIAKHYHVKEHLISRIDLRAFGGSALTSDIEVPKDQDVDNQNEIPMTYVPARNTIFLSFALAMAEVKQAQDIFIGVNAMDYSGYPDCRPEYIRSFERMANLATRSGVTMGNSIKIHTPLMEMTKSEIIQTGMKLGVDYTLTHSCYDPTEGGISCGHCDACLLRLKGFKEAGYTDQITYASTS